MYKKETGYRTEEVLVVFSSLRTSPGMKYRDYDAKCRQGV